MLLVISILFAVLGAIVSGILKRKFNQYSEVPLTNGRTGAEVAAAMLRYNQYDVKITQVDGQLTDHYNPQDKTVNLSYDVYYGRNVAAGAAHQCGHAVQHATAYNFLQARSNMVPIVNIAASLQQYLFMAALVGMSDVQTAYDDCGLVAFGVTTLFSLETLPVEFDASNRALAWLEGSNFAVGAEHDGAEDACGSGLP
jgi:Zn-dependent membrane protease YugP